MHRWGAAALGTGGLVALLLVLQSGCATSPTRSADALRVGIAPERPPLAFVEDGEVGGLEADFARQLAVELGRRADLVVLPQTELIPALRTGRVDIVMSGLAITSALSGQVAFTRPYLRSSQMALIRREDAERLGLRRSLIDESLNVGFEPETGSELFVRTRLPRARPVAIESVDAGVAALRDGRIDVFIADAPTVWRVSAGHREGWMVGVFRPLTEEYLAWAMRPEDAQLRTEVNVILRRWERTGVLEALLNRWMPMRAEVR